MQYYPDIPANKETRLEITVQLGRLLGDEVAAAASFCEMDRIAQIIHAAAFTIVAERYQESGAPMTTQELREYAERLSVEAIAGWSSQNVKAAIREARTIDSPDKMQQGIADAAAVFRQKIAELRKKT